MRTKPFVATCDTFRLPGQIVVPDDAKAFVLLLHGIPSGRPPDPGDDDPGYPGLCNVFAARGFAAGWFDMRGVRDAEGSYSPAGWERDVHAVLDHLAPYDDLAALPRVLIGNSGSGPTALRVTAQRSDVAAVATLASVANWLEHEFLPEPETWLLHLRSIGIVRDPSFPASTTDWFAEFGDDGRAVLNQIAPRPVLIVHGEADDVVPYHHAELLYDAALEPKELVRIPGASHQLRRDPRALDALTVWLNSLKLEA